MWAVSQKQSYSSDILYNLCEAIKTSNTHTAGTNNSCIMTSAALEEFYKVWKNNPDDYDAIEMYDPALQELDPY